MYRFSVRAACLLLAAAAWAGAPASGADIPIAKPSYLMSDATQRILETASLTLQDPGFLPSRQWVFLPSPNGQPGQVLIVDPATNSRLDTDPASDTLMVSRPNGNPSLSQMWRIIEDDVSGVSGLGGAFLIMNVQTGKLLNADNPAKLLGPDDSISNRKWRLISARGLRWTTPNPSVNPATKQSRRNPLQFPSGGGPKRPFFAPTGTGAENFTGKPVDVTVTVTLVGDGTNELTAQVQMTATDRSTTLQGTTSFSVLKVATGKRIFLLPGQQTIQTCQYTDTDSLTDVVVPGAGKIAVPPPIPAATNSLHSIIAGCVCMGEPGPPGPTGVTVILESIPVLFAENPFPCTQGEG
jgi:hypothetical protein